jgi:hypothetical protein
MQVRTIIVECLALFGGLNGLTCETRAQTTLGFDPPSLPAVSTFASVPNGYGGLTWNNFDYINHSYRPRRGYDLGTVSLPNAAFNAFADVASIVAPTDYFNLDSLEFTAAFVPGLEVTLECFNTNASASPLFTANLILSNTAPTLFQFNVPDAFEGINLLRFTPTNAAGGEFALDDFTFTTTTTIAQVPEPASIRLAATVLCGVAVEGLRKRCCDLGRQPRRD